MSRRAFQEMSPEQKQRQVARVRRWRAAKREKRQAVLVHKALAKARVEAKHLQAYLDEFAFRFNRRKSRHVGMLFFRLAQQGPRPSRLLPRPDQASAPPQQVGVT